MKNKGFTLAEVLITLTILGVVAAIAIPNMIQNYKNRLTVTKLQKAYSTLNSAATNIKASTGCENVACLQKFGWEEENPSSGNSTTTTLQSKFAEAAGLPPQALTILNQEGWIRPKFLHCETNEQECEKGYFYGTVLMKDNIWYHASYSKPNGSKNLYLTITVGTDYNKDKNNYTYGRNLFIFVIHDNFDVSPGIYTSGGGFYPVIRKKYSKETIYEYCNPNIVHHLGAYSGNSCAARIILDGWKIKY